MTQPSMQGAHVLVIDDEPVNVQLLERVLAGAGYANVRSTTDPMRAEALYEEFCPDLVLLDLHMPRMDGFAVLDMLTRKIPAGHFLPVLVLTADASASSKQRALLGGAKDFLTKPFDTAEVLARVGNLLETRALHVQLRDYSEELETKVQERTGELWTTIGQLERAQADLRHAQEETIHSLSLAAEFRDDETSRHIERMSRYCSIVAEAMGLGAERRETIRIASKMHDVGKIGIPDAILLKPSTLAADEYETMKRHAQIGYEILRGASSELATTAARIAWTHHEKVDGSGYPRGLIGDDIPLEGRIAAVADVFDALTTNRVYRAAYTLPEALTIMKQGRGLHFDNAILEVFFDRINDVLALKQELDNPAA